MIEIAKPKKFTPPIKPPARGERTNPAQTIPEFLTRIQVFLDAFYMISGIMAFITWLVLFFLSDYAFWLWLIPLILIVPITNGMFIILLVRFPEILDKLGTGKGTAETRWVKAIVVPNTINFFIFVALLYFAPLGGVIAASIIIIISVVMMIIYTVIKESYNKAVEEMSEFYTGFIIPLGMVAWMVISIIVIILVLI